MADLFHQRQSCVASCSGRPHTAATQGLRPEQRNTSNESRRGRAVVRALPVLPSTRTSLRQLDRRDATEKACCRDPIAYHEDVRMENAPREEARPGVPLLPLFTGAALLEALDGLLPRASSAAEALPIELLSTFLDSVSALGIYGPVVFVATVIGAEMVPLFPTQPLTIASGLLFGTPKGAALALIATSSAAILAFQLSRRVGRRLAERVVAEELSDEDRRGGMFARVQTAIDSGSFWQQLIAVTLLRLTPVVPFSASNYLLGATPLKFSAYLVGSVAGLSFWCAVFASLGGAGRDLLESGLSLDALYKDLLSQASSYTGNAAVAAVMLAAVAVLFFKFGPQASPDSK